MTSTRVDFPDAELWGTGFIRTFLAGRPEAYAQGVSVSNKVPNPRVDRMVQVRRNGGISLAPAPLDMARISVNVWATTESDATALANLVRSALMAADGQPPVAGVRDLSGPTSVPDESQQPRRFFTLEVALRGS